MDPYIGFKVKKTNTLIKIINGNRTTKGPGKKVEGIVSF